MGLWELGMTILLQSIFSTSIELQTLPNSPETTSIENDTCHSITHVLYADDVIMLTKTFKCKMTHSCLKNI